MKHEKNWKALVRKDTDGELITCEVFIDGDDYKFVSEKETFIAPCKPLPLARGRCVSDSDNVSALYTLKMKEEALEKHRAKMIERFVAFARFH